jgi:uncharacterized protein YjbI with pentapeptide repeats
MSLPPFAERFTDLVHLCGINSPVEKAYDCHRQETVILRHGLSQSKAKDSVAFAKLHHPTIPNVIEEIATPSGHSLVLKCPSPEPCALLLEGSPYPLNMVQAVGRSLESLLLFLKSYNLLLTTLQSDDLLIDSSGKVMLINLDNTTPWNHEVAHTRQAQADVVLLLFQMLLGTDYTTISKCVGLQNRQLHLCHIPPELPQSITALAKELLPPDLPPQPSTVHKYTPRKRTAFNRPQNIIKRALPLVGVVLMLGGAVHAVSSYVAHKAHVEALAKKELERKENEERAKVEAIRQKEAQAEAKRRACIAAIKNSTAGDCSGQNLVGIEAIDHDLSGIKFDGSNLTNANLDGAILAGLTLKKVNLTSASLRGADLSYITAQSVVWTNADLMESTLAGAELKYADLSKATLGEIDLSNADISHTNLRGVNISNQQLTAVTAIGTDFQGASLKGVTFSGGHYQKVNFNDSNLSSAVFSDVFIDESTFSKVLLGSARFIRATLHSTIFTESDLLQIIIQNSEFSGVSFSDSALVKARIESSSISGGSFHSSSLRNVVAVDSSFIAMSFADTNLGGAKFTDTDFSRSAYFNPSWGVTLENVVMPDGTVENPKKKRTTPQAGS